MKRAFTSSGLAAVFVAIFLMSAPSAFGQVDALSFAFRQCCAKRNGLAELELKRVDWQPTSGSSMDADLSGEQRPFHFRECRGINYQRW
jgi:hypothetical protein